MQPIEFAARVQRRSWLVLVCVLVGGPLPCEAPEVPTGSELGRMLRLVVDSVAQRTDAARSWEPGNLSLRFALTPLHGTRRFDTSVVAEIRSHPIVLETCDPNVERCVGEGYVMLMQVSEPILRSDGQLAVMASLSGDDAHRGDPSKGFAISWTVLLDYDGAWIIDGIEMSRISAP